ncbi:hypothetical protein Pta02_43090 [Planobispora takensis]|uniref:Uncharacterized protein n=1 Tax=Planobispora takensis TaxID=1367882 RepID=A0A8J3SYW4_9ACTN|nr:hypothetical protein Pta02_43090 [Planobispora takensis]
MSGDVFGRLVSRHPDRGVTALLLSPLRSRTQMDAMGRDRTPVDVGGRPRKRRQCWLDMSIRQKPVVQQEVSMPRREVAGSEKPALA